MFINYIEICTRYKLRPLCSRVVYSYCPKVYNWVVNVEKNINILQSEATSRAAEIHTYVGLRDE